MTGTEVLPIARTLSVMLTHKCNAECTHCGTLSGPKVGGRADLETVLAAIDQAAEIGFANVVFTGGEPTIYFDDLLASIAHAGKLGLITRVVTNGGWCKTPERTDRKLERLIDAGLQEINFSAGDEHQRFISLEYVVNGIVSALDHRLPIHLMIEKVKLRNVTKEVVLDHKALRSHPHLERLGISESPWMPLDPFQINEYEGGHTANADNISHFSGCDSILQTYVLHPLGEVTSCCGIGARVISELRSEQDFKKDKKDSLSASIIDAEEDFLKLWMRQEGPEKILHWAASHDPKIKWENMYAHRCQACARIYADHDVRKVLFDKYEEMIADVLAKAYLFEKVDLKAVPRWISEVSTDSGSRVLLAPTVE